MKRWRKGIFLFLLLAGFFLLGWNNGFSLFFRAGYVLLGVIAISRLWLWFNLRHVDGKFGLHPHRLQAGQEIEAQVELKNGDRWPKLGMVVGVSSDLPQADGETGVALPGSRLVRWQWSIPCQRRGRYTLGPLTVSSQDPFGLFRQVRHFGSPQPILVYPAMVRLSPPTLPQTPFSAGSSLRPQAAGEQVGGIRDYQPGDSYSHIHWPSSAKRRQLISKELEGETAQDAWLLLDMEAQAQAGQGVETTQEYGITLAASLARAYLQANYSLGLATWDQYLHLLPPARSEAHFWQVLETLALAQGRGLEPLSRLIQAVAPQCKAGSMVIAITPAPLASWVSWLLLLQRGGTRVAVLSLEADSFKNGHQAGQDQSPDYSYGLPVYKVRQGQALEQVFQQELQG